MSGETLRIAGGRIYLDRALYERYFRGIDSVVLLRDRADLLVMPVASAASGGYLIKLRNPEGDRVIDAADVLRGHGLDDGHDGRSPLRWSPERAALCIEGLFVSQIIAN